jgi:hemerythrin-like domain-containing protein
MDEAKGSRRAFLRTAGVASCGFVLGFNPMNSTQQAAAAKNQSTAVKADVEEVLPVEDLMREHGVLRRILLIYGEAIRRLGAGQDFDPKVVASAADIIRRFIEDYHEKSEEEHLFPHFEKAGKLVELVRILKEQHKAGRRVTTSIQGLATRASLASDTNRKVLAQYLRQFIRMYEPHAAREDTVLFPAFRSVITPKQYDAYSDLFEDKEHQLFGPNGFEDIVGQVAELEKALGILELSQFTPR